MEERYCIYDRIGVLFDELGDVYSDNFKFFSSRGKQVDMQFAETFERILNVIEPMKVALDELSKVCANFDVDSETRGNGFRSLICITEKCLFKILELGIYIQKSRDRFFFRSYHNYMEIESYSQVVSRLFTVIQVALSLGTILDQDSLFADEDKYPDEVAGLMSDFETIGRECFYGRSFGFQFSPALQQSLHVIAVALAAYGDGFKRHNGNMARALSSVLHSGKYVVDPELRAKRIVELTQHVSMPFCKAFWSLTENHGIQHVPMLICPSLSINKELSVLAEHLVIQSLNGARTIDPPFLMKRPKIIQARLLSYAHREGQGKPGSSDSSTGSLGRKMHGLSQNLLLHCHGGGFVAQSSKSHEIYLRNWAKELQCPILSIDYSLAPDAPYPEALNECFYMYNWAILNCKSLGWTAERICLAGDSAGGNLMMALALKLIEEQIRLPDGLVIAYPPLRVQYTPSPSRMLAMMDPLLPPAILKVCLRAYAGHAEEEIEEFGSTSSLRTPMFEDVYNPFDLDLGDAINAAKHRNLNDITGRRSYSESNLADGDHYCVSRPLIGCLKCRKISGEIPKVQSRRGSESDSEADGLQMRPIKSRVQESTEGRVNKLKLNKKRNTKIYSLELSENDELGLSEEIESHAATAPAIDVRNDLDMQKEYLNDCKSIGSEKESEGPKMDEAKGETNGEGPKVDQAKDETNGEGRKVDQAKDETCDEGPKTDQSKDETNDSDRIKRRKHRSKTLPNHRRSLSDSIAESFQRWRPNSVDFETVKQLSSTSDSDNEESENCKIENRELSLADGVVKQNSFENFVLDKKTHATEFKALYIKETKDCVIVSRTNVTSEQTSSGGVGVAGNIEKMVERNDSDDSITSSVKRRGKDPLMSPLVASDEALKQLPKLIIVACSLDPLLDDAVDFIRRLKKLQKDGELFIVDDLPHGFLNLNFACNEAREASDLIVACIKRVLKIGLKHVNSFPLSPEAAKEFNERSNDLP